MRPAQGWLQSVLERSAGGGRSVPAYAAWRHTVTRGLGGNDELGEAAAASVPYGDIARLLRLLGGIGTSAQVSETVDSTLMILADGLRADMACVAAAVGDRLVPTAVFGPSAGDQTIESVWPLGRAAREALDRGTPVARAMVASLERPSSLRGLPRASGAWI